jgi:hypothetical protein
LPDNDQFEIRVACEFVPIPSQGLLSEGEPTKSCENYRSIHADAWSPRSLASAPLTANAVSAAALAVSVAAQRRASAANRWRPALQTVFDVDLSHDDAASDSDSDDAAVKHPTRRSSSPSSCASPPSKQSRQRAASMSTVTEASVARAAGEAAAAAAAAGEAGAPEVDVVDDSHRGRQGSDDSSSSSSSGSSDDRDSGSDAEDESASPTAVTAYTHREGRGHYFAKAGASPVAPDEEERFVAFLAVSTTG